MKKKLAELALLGAGQVATALGVLAGIRLLTEFLSPSAYGEMTLWLGMVTLVTGSTALPYLQAALKHYTEAELSGQSHTLRREVTRWTTRLALITAAAVTAGIAIFELMSGDLGWVSVAILAAAVGSVVLADTLRSTQLTLMNAAGRNFDYSLWCALDAWLRPVLALMVVYFILPSATAALLGTACASLLIAAGIHWRERLHEKVLPTSYLPLHWHTKLLRYSRPLVPLALFGWVSGMFDRYLLASMASLVEVGIYAAMYGLASRPFLMLSTVAELSFRQSLYAAVARADRPGLNRIMTAWLLLASAGVLVLFAMFWYGHAMIAHWLVGKAFGTRSDLMVWIAFGYGLLVMCQVLERLCYATGKTDWVLKNQIVGSVSSLIIAMPAIYFWGIDGAARAVPLYFGLQLVVTSFFAFHIWRKGAHLTQTLVKGTP